jgi:23S rRNA pseudouridine2605 synthase
MRLQKYLARAGVASRRASEDLIRQGRVRVDGDVVTEMGSRVDPERSRVEVDGRHVELSPARWIALHKTPGTLCTRSDPRGRPTVYDDLPRDHEELFHVGRLDYMSEGLLLLTNEGDLAHGLLHPSAEVEKRYEVGLVEPAPPGLARRLLEGVALEDGPAAADAASLLAGRGEGPVLLVTLHEGRNREIRRMLDALGARIRYLKRVAFGPVELGDLPPGAWRELRPEEREALKARVREHGG